MLDLDKQPLAGAPRVASTPGGVQVTPAERGVRYAFRCGAASLSAAAGYRLDGRVNSCVLENGHLSVRLGPDEWLLAGPGTTSFEAQLSSALGAQFHSLVDVSHRYLTTVVEGPHARALLNRGCPLDLDDATFPAGYATRTHFGKAEIILIRPQAQNRFEIESARSFTPYVRGLLAASAADELGR